LAQLLLGLADQGVVIVIFPRGAAKTKAIRLFTDTEPGFTWVAINAASFSSTQRHRHLQSP
jgi:hypothetical protein